jgi:N-glycosylase/DNA lyase
MKTLTLDPDQPFDLDCTLSCGQLFRWQKQGDVWQGVVQGSIITIRQRGRRLSYSGAADAFLRTYFALDIDLDAILESVDRDPVIHDAVVKHRGLRIVKQDPWECLISYICAQNANIPRIQKMIETLSAQCGDGIDPVTYAFPNPEALAMVSEPDLRRCGLGYRAPYIFETAKRVADDPGWGERISRLSFADARNALMAFRGVGPKVADCILLFSFGRYEAFPVDVWIRKVMYSHYLQNACRRDSLGCREYEFIAEFARRHFGRYAGYAQEYLYAAHRGI